MSFLAQGQPFSICAWLYPESKAKELAGYKVLSEHPSIEQVTTYSGGALPKHTELVPATKANIVAYFDAKMNFIANCDSLALYSGQS